MNWELLVDLIFGPVLIITALVMYDYAYQIRYEGSEDRRRWVRWGCMLLRIVICLIATWHIVLGILMTVNKVVGLIMGGPPWD